jgi:hypothetical protein
METAKPKKNLSAYMLFCRDARASSRDKTLSVHDLSELWNSFKDNPSKKRELDYYNKLAEKDAERYQREIAIYREKNKEVIRANKEEAKQANKQAKQLQKLRRDEQRIQEKMRELESKVQYQSTTTRNSRAEPREEDSKPKERNSAQSKPQKDRLNLLLQKIQNEKKPSRDSPYTSSDYDSDDL